MNRISTFFAASVFLSLTGFLCNGNAQTQAKRFTHENKTYEIVEQKMNWEDAAKYAKDKGGYLMQIETQAEQQAMYHEIVTNGKVQKNYTTVNDGGGIAYVWIGANDKAKEGEWKWDGDNDGNGEKFWEGQGANGEGNGKTVNERYQNWGGGQGQSVPNEPDNFLGKQNAAAIGLEAWPKGAGFLGKTGEWNDIDETNALYFIIEYDYSDVPPKPEIIQGAAESCVGSATEYTCSVIEEATAYEWIVNPESAAEIEVNNNIATITWLKGFSGNASVQVRAINPLGEGDVSDEYNVMVKDIPPTPEIPDGEKVLQSEEKPETSYSIAAIPDAKTYEWLLNPTEAGEITAEGINATVAWNDDYHGEVFLSARALNECGESEYGEALSISVNEFISVDDNPIPALELFPNPTGGAISITNLPSGESTIEIYDVEAKLVNQLKSNTSKLDFRIDKAGVYLVKITNGNSILTKKVVVK